MILTTLRRARAFSCIRRCSGVNVKDRELLQRSTLVPPTRLSHRRRDRPGPAWAMQSQPTSLYRRAARGYCCRYCRHAQGVLPAAVTKRGTTALMAAALQGHAAVCMALIEEGADVDARNDQDQTALSFAATRGHHKVVFALLDRRRTIAANTSHKMNINDLPDTNGRTPLIHAATGGHLQCCELLLSMARARTNATDSHGRTPLILAATQGTPTLCKLLQDYGADVNQASTHIHH